MGGNVDSGADEMSEAKKDSEKSNVTTWIVIGCFLILTGCGWLVWLDRACKAEAEMRIEDIVTCKSKISVDKVAFYYKDEYQLGFPIIISNRRVKNYLLQELKRLKEDQENISDQLFYLTLIEKLEALTP